MNESHTDQPIKTTPFSLACAGLFTGMMAIGAWQIGAAALHKDGLQFPTTLQAFRSGQLTQTLEKQLDLKMPIRDSLIAGANATRYLILGGAGEQVRVGSDGWLFLTEEMRTWPAESAHSMPATWFEDRLDLIAEVSRRLDQHQVRLLVALVPDKARINRQHLGHASYPAYNEDRYAQAIAGLGLRRVEAVDLLDGLTRASTTQPVYYRTDTHWNQAGAQIAASILAERIKAMALGLDQSQFKTTTGSEPQLRVGDLMKLMGLAQVPDAFRPHPDLEAPATTAESQPANASGGLFGEVQVPIVLTGTSYSLRGNFHGYLQQATGSKVLNTAKDGGGFLQALTAYLNDESFRSSKPRVLIWEIPERMLKMPLAEEKSWLTALDRTLPRREGEVPVAAASR
jgi:alginate O-acetyltransferase complex protein AlgJ